MKRQPNPYQPPAECRPPGLGAALRRALGIGMLAVGMLLAGLVFRLGYVLDWATGSDGSGVGQETLNRFVVLSWLAVIMLLGGLRIALRWRAAGWAIIPVTFVWLLALRSLLP